MQVRNLKSCIKVAIDFVSPESFEHVLELTQERRWLTLREAREKPEEAAAPPQQRRHGDKLQVEDPCTASVCCPGLHAALRALGLHLYTKHHAPTVEGPAAAGAKALFLVVSLRCRLA